MLRTSPIAICVALLLSLVCASALAEKLPDLQRSTLDPAFRAMYDLNFQGAMDDIKRFENAHSDDPLGPVAEAAAVLFETFDKYQILQSEFFTSDNEYKKRKPVTPDPQSVQRFETALNRAEQLGNNALGRDPSDRNALFSMTLVYGLRSDYAALIERRDFAALHFSEHATEFARKLLALAPDYYDAYVATGIQKYLVGLRSAPVRWVLGLGGVKGDVNAGMQELGLAAEKGRYLAPFARILLAIAYLRKDQRTQALNLLADLRDQYPHNPLFAEEVARLHDLR